MDVKKLELVLIYCLFLILPGNCDGSERMEGELAVLRMRTDDHAHHHPSDNAIFFLLEDLKEGNTLTGDFPTTESVTDSFARLLSKAEADSIPFGSQHLRTILQLFSIPQDSPQAKAMGDTLHHCEPPQEKGEEKLCAASMESMLNFLHRILGSETRLQAVSTTRLSDIPAVDIHAQQYTILQIKEFKTPKSVSCHKLPYPYLVFGCHQIDGTRTFRVAMAGENDDRVEASVVCHMDTSRFKPDHVAFRLLGTQPGMAPVCHFTLPGDFVWVPLQA